MPAAPADSAALLLAAARRLRRQVDALDFGPPVAYVQDPLDYAWRGHRAYVERYARGRKRVVFVGMNPGPFGMAQTGVPFGDVASVRDWLGITAKIDAPARSHPKRPVQGFDCPRAEVSGTRLWGAIRDHFGTPARFFARHFISNYCPLVFVEASGRNRTPDKLPAREREALFAACDRHLRRVVEVLDPEWVVGIGAFAEERARAVLRDTRRVGRVLHPSPANPRAQRDWAGLAQRELEAQGVCKEKRR